MVWALRQRLITALIGSNTEAEADYALDSLPPHLTLALFFAFPLGIISPQISLLTKKCIFELLVSSPGQGNSETRRLLTLRRSFYRFRISYDERTIPPTTLRRRNQEQPNPTTNNLGYMNNCFEAPRRLRCNDALFI